MYNLVRSSAFTLQCLYNISRHYKFIRISRRCKYHENTNVLMAQYLVSGAILVLCPPNIQQHHQHQMGHMYVPKFDNKIAPSNFDNFIATSFWLIKASQHHQSATPDGRHIPKFVSFWNSHSWQNSLKISKLAKLLFFTNILFQYIYIEF